MQFSPTSCYFVSPSSKYSLQLPLLKCPQYIYFLLRLRPRFTPVQDNTIYLTFILIVMIIVILEVSG
jgi:hypothetical protein